MSFFNKFPKIQYDVEENNIFSSRVDIYRHVDVANIRTDDYSSYLFYEIKDSERPDIVSQKLYKTPDHYWTFFILNDFLQGGFNEWYKSYIDFHKGLENEYSDHGAFLFLPNLATSSTEISSVNSPEDNTRNMLNGLDLNHDYLRFIKSNTSPQETAKIERYDNFMLQLITHGASSVNYYDIDESPVPSETYHLGFSSTATDTQKSEWLQIYTDYLKSINAISADLDTLIESDLSSYTYTPYKAYEELLNAPYRFTTKNNTINSPIGPDSPEETSYIGTYDALHTNRSLGSIDNFLSWYEYENDNNEARRRIRYVRPELIEEFVESYENLINS
tara:strand:+ start:3170 stop:4168 length:999 start_codon:yes stop_codon:yes gene_type:complete